MDINDAAEKIIRLYKEPQLAQAMGQNGRKAAVKEYDFETVVGPQWEKLICH